MSAQPAAAAAQSSPAPAAVPPPPADDDADDDGPVQLSDELLSMLSPEARSALSSHLSEKAAAAAALKAAQADGQTEIGEDFAMSQFWYTDECADELARTITEAALARAGPEATVRIACISAPSAFKGLKRLNHPRVKPFVLEYDRRFEAFRSEFVFYDFHHPSSVHSTYTDDELGGPLRKSFDGIVADPPYLNEECMSKTGETIRILAKSLSTPLLFNTGAVLRKPIRLVLHCRPCVVRPRHRVSIMNPFLTYSNFDAERLGGWEKDDEQ